MTRFYALYIQILFYTSAIKRNICVKTNPLLTTNIRWQLNKFSRMSKSPVTLSWWMLRRHPAIGWWWWWWWGLSQCDCKIKLCQHAILVLQAVGGSIQPAVSSWQWSNKTTRKTFVAIMRMVFAEVTREDMSSFSSFVIVFLSFTDLHKFT